MHVCDMQYNNHISKHSILTKNNKSLYNNRKKKERNEFNQKHANAYDNKIIEIQIINN